MLYNYLKITLRGFSRYRSYSLINIIGLALGMLCSTLTIIWIQDETDYDRFHEKADNIYRVVENQYYAGGELFPVALTPSALAPALKNQFPEIVAATRLAIRNYTLSINNKPLNEPGILVDKDFLEMFSFSFVAGDSATALYNPHSIVLTERAARRHFGEEDPIGEVLTVNGREDFVVTGLIADIPSQSHLDFEFILPFSFLEELGRNMNEWGRNSFYTYIELPAGVSQESVDSKIINLIKDNNAGSTVEIYLQALTKIHLYSAGKYTADISGHGDIFYVRVFAFIAFIILIVAAINFMNLSTARSERRSKEVALRKAVGAQRSQIIGQFFFEAVATSLLAFILSLLLSNMLLPLFNDLTGKQLLMNEIEMSLLFSLVVICLLTGLVSGAYPAFVLSSFRPAASLKAGAHTTVGHATFRKILVVIQFSFSIIIIIGVLTMSKQMDFIKNKDLGLTTSNMAYIWMNSELRSNYEVLKQELLQTPGVSHVTASSQIPTYIVTASSNASWSGKNPNDELLLHTVSVDEDFADTFRIELLQGQFFSSGFPSSESGIVINERAAELMGVGASIGGTVSYNSRDFTIIGVVRDFHFKSVHTEIEPLMMFMSPTAFQAVLLRFNTDSLSDSINQIESVHRRLAPSAPFDIYFLDESYNNLYASEEKIAELSNYFAVTAILISCLGLFGLSTFMAEKQTKEIGIRKVLGASVSQILFLLSKNFIVLILIANVIAWPVAYLIMNTWLKNYAYHTELSTWTFLNAAVITMILVATTTIYQAARTAVSNPVDALQNE